MPNQLSAWKEVLFHVHIIAKMVGHVAFDLALRGTGLLSRLMKDQCGQNLTIEVTTIHSVWGVKTPACTLGACT